MKYKNGVRVFFLACVLIFVTSAVIAEKPADLLCNGLTNPTKLDDYTPVFTWSFYSAAVGDYQTDYQLRIGTMPGASIVWEWDSGKVPSLSQDRAYDGPALSPNTDYFWSVRVWDQDSNLSEYSDNASFRILDIGFRAYNGTDIVKIAADDNFSAYPLRIFADGQKYGIKLVESTDADGSGFIVQTQIGKKSMKRMDETPDVPTPSVNGILMGIYNTVQNFTVTGEPGATVEYSNNNGLAWNTYSTGVALVEGEYQVIARQTDLEGNLSLATRPAINVIVDLTEPLGYSVGIDQSYIYAGNTTDLSFTFLAAEIGANYLYSIDDTNAGTASVSGSGTVTSPDETVSSIDVTSLADGTLTLTVSLTDVAGNKGADVTDTVLKDIVNPTVALSDNHPDAFVGGADTIEITATFTEAGEIDELVPPEITIGTIVTSAAMTRITNLQWRYTWDVPAGINGNVGVSIDAADTAANVSTPATGQTAYTIDNTPPTQPGTPTTASPTTDTTPTWTWGASADSGSGLRLTNTYQVFWDTVQGGESFNAFTNTNSYTHASVLAVNTWYFKVRAFDKVNNQSSVSGNGSVTIVPPPTGPTISVLNFNTDGGAIPGDLKVTYYDGPDSPDGSTYTTPIGPVIIYNGITYWPLSYINNDNAIALVGYNSSKVQVFRKHYSGPRYIWQITVNTSNQTITLWGQVSLTATFPWSDLLP